MKTLVAAIAFIAVLAAPAFARSASVAPAKAKSAYAASFSNPYRGVRSNPTCARNYNYSPASICFTTNGW